VEDLDQELVDRVVSGAIDLEISNPWAIGASVTLTIDGPTMGSPIVKAVAVPALPTSTVRVEFSQAELQSFLGQPGVTLSGTGTVASDATSITVTPDQVLVMDGLLDLILRIG
jgi:hypothetical protein